MSALNTHLAGAVRAAVKAWGLAMRVRRPNPLLEHDYDRARARRRRQQRLDDPRPRALRGSLGGGIGEGTGTAFRIGHLGALNELEVMATIGEKFELAFADIAATEALGGLWAPPSLRLERDPGSPSDAR